MSMTNIDWHVTMTDVNVVVVLNVDDLRCPWPCWCWSREGGGECWSKLWWHLEHDDIVRWLMLTLRCMGNFKKYLTKYYQMFTQVARPFAYIIYKVRDILSQKCWKTSQKRVSYTKLVLRSTYQQIWDLDNDRKCFTRANLCGTILTCDYFDTLFKLWIWI